MKKLFIPLTILILLFGTQSAESETIQMQASPNLAKATFAGGCFWCMEGPFDKLKGVKSTIVGYAGGNEKDPTYQEVASGATGHTETVEVYYDPKEVTYEELLKVFWMNIDPTTLNGQFADKGRQYRTAIFYHNEEQKNAALQSREELEKSGKFKDPIVTEVTPASDFFKAEEYHQDYYQKNPFHYKAYRVGSGRESYLQKTWGKKKK